MNAQVSVFPSLAPSPSRFTLSPEARATLIELACDFATPGSVLYGLGHAVAELLPTLHAKLARAAHFIHSDLNRGVIVRDASVAILAGTSQQVHPLQRQQLLMDVYHGLRTGGCALVMEVVRSHDSLLNNLFAFHPWPNEHGGSCDIAEATQMAGTLDEERGLLGRSGFRSVELFYKHYGLCGLIAIK